MSLELIRPEWPAPPAVCAFVTTRAGGVSVGPYACLNLGDHVGDAAATVAANRRIVRACLPSEPLWLRQVHGVAVARFEASPASLIEADASVAFQERQVCAILTADCLPVLFCDRAGTVVAAAHAGWRGLLAGVLEHTLKAMNVPPSQVLAWLGPAIGPTAFEVGGEVREAFVGRDAAAGLAFQPGRQVGKWWADLACLARMRLEFFGVGGVWGGGECTFSDAARYFSYRRDGVTGRQGAFIWREAFGDAGCRI